MDHDGSFYSFAMDSMIHNNVADILASVLAENGVLHYEAIIKIAVENGYRVVGKYFSDFDTSERYWFFRDRPEHFVITKSGYTIPSDSALQRFREEKEDDVIDYFVEVLKSSPNMHFLRLVKSLQYSASKVKHYFDFSSTSDFYWFFKNHSTVFEMSGGSYVSLRCETKGASDEKEISDNESECDVKDDESGNEASGEELSDDENSSATAETSDACFHSMAADEILNEQASAENPDEISDAELGDSENSSVSSEEYSIISYCSKEADEIDNGQANEATDNELNEAELSDSEISNDPSEADSDEPDGNAQAFANKENEISEAELSDNENSKKPSEVDCDTSFNSEETGEIGNVQANGDNEISDADIDSSEMYCDTRSTFSDPIIFPEHNVVEILTSILVRCGSMHYQSLIKNASRKGNRDVLKYFSNLNSSQKFWFFRNRPSSFVIANSGYVLPSDSILDRFKQLELGVIDYFVAFLKTTSKMHFLKLVKCLRNSDSYTKHYFDSSSDSDIYWFFKNRPSIFMVGKDSYVSLPEDEAATVGKGISNNVLHAGVTNVNDGCETNQITEPGKLEKGLCSDRNSESCSGASSPSFLVIDSVEDAAANTLSIKLDCGSVTLDCQEQRINPIEKEILISVPHDKEENYHAYERKDVSINAETINSDHLNGSFISENSIGQTNMETPDLFALKPEHKGHQKVNENFAVEQNNSVAIKNIHPRSCDLIHLKIGTNVPNTSITDYHTLSEPNPERRSCGADEKVDVNSEPATALNSNDGDNTMKTAIALQYSIKCGYNLPSGISAENYEETVIQTLSSVLTETGKMNYLLLTSIALQGKHSSVRNYFRNFDFCEKRKFFESHPSVFVIRDNGIVHLTNAVLDQFVEKEEEKTEKVLNIFVTSLKASGSMHYTELVKSLQDSESDVNGYFDSPFKCYLFLKSYSSVFVIDSNCYVHLSENQKDNKKQNNVEMSQPDSPLMVNLALYNDIFTRITDALNGISDKLDQYGIQTLFSSNSGNKAMTDKHTQESIHEIKPISDSETDLPIDSKSDSVESIPIEVNAAVLSLTEAHIQSVRYFVILLRKWKSANYHKLLYKVCRYDSYTSDFFSCFTLSDVLEFIRMHSMYFSIQDDTTVELVDSKIIPSDVLDSEDHVREVVSSMEAKAVEYFVSLLRHKKCLLPRELEYYLGAAPGYIISFFVANYYGEDFSKFFEQHLIFFHVRTGGYIELSSEISRNESLEESVNLMPVANFCTTSHESKENVLNTFNSPCTNVDAQEHSDESSDSGCPP